MTTPKRKACLVRFADPLWESIDVARSPEHQPPFGMSREAFIRWAVSEACGDIYVEKMKTARSVQARGSLGQPIRKVLRVSGQTARRRGPGAIEK